MLDVRREARPARAHRHRRRRERCRGARWSRRFRCRSWCARLADCAARDRRGGAETSLHAGPLSERRHQIVAQRRLPLDLRARGEVSVLSRRHLHQRGAVDGAAGHGSLYVELSDRGPMPDVDDIMPDVAQALAAAGAINSADDVLFAELKELKYAYVVFDDNYYSCVENIDYATSSRTTSIRAAAMARGSTTRWRTRSSPAATSRRGSTRERDRRTSRSSFRSTTRKASSTRRWSIWSPRLDELGWDYELLLAENGSSDRTVALGEELSQEAPAACRSIRSASRTTARRSRRASCARAASFVICDEIDLCDTDFYQRALAHPRATMTPTWSSAAR